MDQLINKIKNYIFLSDKETELIKTLFHECSFKKNESILEQGKTCKFLYYVNRGLLRHYINYNGKEISIHFNEENNFASDYQSFITQSFSNETIIALENTDLFSINYNDLQTLYTEIQYGERLGRFLLEEFYGQSMQRIISVYTDSAEQRYLKFITQYKQLQQRIPQIYIASFIGVTPQSLSRIRKRLVKK